MSSMRLRPNKRKVYDDSSDDKEESKTKARRASNSGNGAASGGFGAASPAKKPRTSRPRAASGSKVSRFFAEENGKDNKGNDSDEYEFSNVVKAVALTLAEVSENESGSPSKETGALGDGRVGGDGKEDAAEGDAGGGAASEGGRAGSAAGGTRSSRGVTPRRTRKAKQLFTETGSDERSGLDALATLADMSLKGLFPDANRKDAEGSEELQDLVSQVLNLQNPVKSEAEMPAVNKRPTRRKRVPEKLADSARLDSLYKPNGRPKRVPTKSALRKNDDFEHDMDRLDRMDDSASYCESDHPKPKTKKRLAPAKPAAKKEKSGTPSCAHVFSEHGPFSTRVRLLHCLSQYKLRRWCTYEWLYSAIDLPWFMRNEFVEYIEHAGLRHVSRLTRTEWSVIRSCLGKPRRFSQKFLQEEREKLESYRESVRDHYQQLKKDGLPPDLARPLAVAQRVMARHPKTGELHDGRILTVDRNRCRVQFDRTELGVFFVQDVDAMPVDPLENMSEVMKKQRIIDLNGSRRFSYDTSSQYFLNNLCRRAQMDTVDSVVLAKAAANEAAAAVQSQGQPHSSAHAQAREADIRALAELSRQLDKKEALLVELRRMNDEAHSHEDPKIAEAARRQCATVVLQLREVNKQVSAALLQLRQRNRYQENMVPPWHSPSACSMDAAYSGGLGAGSPAEEITLTTRKDARSMVSAAVQAICCLKEGEDISSKQGNAHNQECEPGGISNANEQPVNPLSSADKGDALQSAGNGEPKSQGCIPEATFTTGMESFIPTELVTSCVATLLMIRTCSERPLPPSDIAVMIENALANLRPRSAKNHQLYKEIEQLFEIIKNQVTAQVTMHPGTALPVDCHLR